MNFLSFFLSYFLFYQSTALSSRAVDGHQMNSGGLVVGKASTRDLAHQSHNFHRGGSKSAKFGVVFNIT